MKVNIKGLYSESEHTLSDEQILEYLKDIEEGSVLYEKIKEVEKIKMKKKL